MTDGRKTFTEYLILFLCAALLCSPFVDRQKTMAEPVAASEKTEVFLYFAHPDRRHLTARPIYLASTMDEYELGLVILKKLLQSSKDPVKSKDHATSALPSGMALRAFFMDNKGQAWVDLSLEKDAKGKIPFSETDSIEEILAVYSIVHSLCLNLQQVDTVKILINGADSQSLGGHLDLEHFYTPNMALVK